MINIKEIPAINDDTFLSLSEPTAGNGTASVDPHKLNVFLADAAPHMEALSKDQLSTFQGIVGKLASPAVADKSTPLAQLADFGKTVASSVLSALIVSFLV